MNRQTLYLSLFLTFTSSAVYAAGTPTPAADAKTAAPAAEVNIPALIEQLQAPDANLRLQAVTALAAQGPKAKASVPALQKALAETSAGEHPAVRQAARQVAQALRQIDPQAPAEPEALLQLLRHAQEPIGRKRVAGTALFDNDGELCGRAQAVWIEVKDPSQFK